MVTNDHFLNELLLKNNENEKPKVESWNRKKIKKISESKHVQKISKVWKSPKRLKMLKKP